MNMNTIAALPPDGSSGAHSEGILPKGLSSVQGQVSDLEMPVHPICNHFFIQPKVIPTRAKFGFGVSLDHNFYS